jgi:hypothetical protein
MSIAKLEGLSKICRKFAEFADVSRGRRGAGPCSGAAASSSRQLQGSSKQPKYKITIFIDKKNT